MKKCSSWIQPALVALAAMGLVAGFLQHRGPRQSLGPAAVRLSHDALETGNAELRTNGVVLPLRLTGFASLPLDVSAEELRFLPADTTFGRRLYRDEVDQFTAMLSVVVMGTDRSSLHRPEQCLGAQGVTITSRQTVRVPTADGGTLEVLRCNGLAPFGNARGAGASRAVFAYLFLAADRQTSSHTQRHLLTMQDLLVRGVMPRWTGIQCFTRCKEGEEDATFEKMKRLLALAVPALRAGAPPSHGG